MLENNNNSLHNNSFDEKAMSKMNDYNATNN